ncbi:MAG: twin-arginine translocase subunit TatC [Muribaculaceae bacterium]|nr:twin-arginine translocase subunit TatC [Muribaculaceae bacterium]MDE6609968.1 twin-arginine translocase subunit TatC [Muribaculaceae bacterium]
MTTGNNTEMAFWDHLEALRGVLFKIGGVIIVAAVTLFIFLRQIMDAVILAPCHPDFPLYRMLSFMGNQGDSAWLPSFGGDDFHVSLINIELASQFFIHMSLSCWLAVVLTFPVIIYLFWTFVRPGLLPRERRGAVKAFAFGNIMFYAGVAVGYYLVFPLTLRFLAGYQLSDSIPNTVSISSYMDNFLMIILLMGVVFELPLLAWLLGRMGLLTRSFFSKYRRHAVVALMIAAAIITPTGDPFTLMMVFLPIYILWEGSALLVPAEAPEDLDEEQDDAEASSSPSV